MPSLQTSASLRRSICVAACAAGLTGCARPLALDALLLRPGMTRTQLQVAIGPAQNIHANGSREIWQYCRRDLFGLRPRGALNVLLVRGKLAGQRVYPGDATDDCDDFYRAFSWQDLAGPAVVRSGR